MKIDRIGVEYINISSKDLLDFLLISHRYMLEIWAVFDCQEPTKYRNTERTPVWMLGHKPSVFYLITWMSRILFLESVLFSITLEDCKEP